MAIKKLSDSFRLSTLIVKHINGQLTTTEQTELDNWIAQSPANKALFENMLNEARRNHQLSLMSAFDAESALKKFQARVAHQHPPAIKRWITPLIYRFAAAAVLILVVGAAWFFIYSNKDAAKPDGNALSGKIISKKVTLTLANGSQIDVGAAKNGVIARQGDAAVSKTSAGVLNYKAANVATAQQIQYNTLTIPRGERYEMTLPDGSRVWLNSESTLKFPVAFSKTERQVQLTGEAYFEVTHNSSQPFRVVANDQIVEVLGTHFNIEAYQEDGRTITTLAQGSVRVSNGGTSSVIKPGQKASSTAGGALIIASADIDEALAWKNGLFSFKDNRVEDMMKEIARSYDVDVAYQGNVKNIKFWGTFPRAKGLNALLKNLEQTNTIHFKLTGRRVLVMP